MLNIQCTVPSETWGAPDTTENGDHLVDCIYILGLEFKVCSAQCTGI